MSYILKKVDVLSYSLCSFLNQFKPIMLSICALCSIIWFMYWQSSFWCFLFTSDLERPKGQRLAYTHLWSSKLLVLHWTIYSATTFLVVLQTQIFFLVNHFSPTRFLLDLWYKTTFFLVNHFSRTVFLEPYFLNQISKNCKKRGCRIKG